MLCESVLSQKSINFFLSKRNLFLESTGILAVLKEKVKAL